MLVLRYLPAAIEENDETLKTAVHMRETWTQDHSTAMFGLFRITNKTEGRLFSKNCCKNMSLRVNDPKIQNNHFLSPKRTAKINISVRNYTEPFSMTWRGTTRHLKPFRLCFWNRHSRIIGNVYIFSCENLSSNHIIISCKGKSKSRNYLLILPLPNNYLNCYFDHNHVSDWMNRLR
jgi:hypothetical protein